MYGGNLAFHYPDGITREEITRIRRIGHLMNQNFVIRLYAILEDHEVIKSKKEICESPSGGEAVYIVRKLRNVFGHSGGKYDGKDKEHVKLLRRLDDLIGSSYSSENCTDWPLLINTVLKPLRDGCVDYINSIADKATGV
jgi:hypothetical protein